MNYISQFYLQFRRQLTIKKYDKLALAVIFVVPIILGFMSGLVFLTDTANDGSGDYFFSLNEQYSAFAFMLIITSIFLGLLISIVEIIKERHILEKEKMFGISVLSYYSAKFVLLAIFSLVQVILLYSIASYILEVPQNLFLNNIFILYIVSINSIALGLLISSYTKSLLVAYNMISILILPQLLLGGGFIPFDSMSSKLKFFDEPKSGKMLIIAKFLPAAWAYEDMMVSSYIKTKGWGQNELLKNLEVEEKSLDEYMSKQKTINFAGFQTNIATSIYNKLILIIESFAFIVMTLLILSKYRIKFNLGWHYFTSPKIT